MGSISRVEDRRCPLGWTAVYLVLVEERRKATRGCHCAGDSDRYLIAGSMRTESAKTASATCRPIRRSTRLCSPWGDCLSRRV